MHIRTVFHFAGVAAMSLLSFTACQTENSSAGHADSSNIQQHIDSVSPSNSDTVPKQNSNARLSTDIRFVITKNEDDANPTSTIELLADGKTNPVSRISGYADLISVADYKSKEIPENALAACGGWWAGAGDYFYVIESGNKLVVYQGWQDEGQTDEGYHWKKMKEFGR